MKTDFLENTNGQLDVKILEAIASYLAIKIPNSYKKFLLDTNGGITKNNFVFTKNKESEYMIRYFFGIVPEYNMGLLERISMYNKRIPINTIPICNDHCGNLILLSVKGSDYGKVYFWDHEREADQGETPDYSNLTLIADSFDEFINGLKSEDEINQLDL